MCGEDSVAESVRLPAECLAAVFSALAVGGSAGDDAPGRAVARASCVSRAWRASGAEELLWSTLFAARWPAHCAAAAPLPWWRGAFAARHALHASVAAVLPSIGHAHTRAAALASLAQQESRHPPAWSLVALQSAVSPACRSRPAERAVCEHAVRAMARALGGARGGWERGASPAALLDASLALSLLLDPSADVDAARAEVARLGREAALRIASAGLETAPNLARLRLLTSFLFNPIEDNGCGFGGDTVRTTTLRQGKKNFVLLCLGAFLHSALTRRLFPLFFTRQEDYYALRNSSLVSLLSRRRGLPIALAVLHTSVAAAAGVSVLPVGLPGHFVTRDPDDVDAYFDVL